MPIAPPPVPSGNRLAPGRPSIPTRIFRGRPALTLGAFTLIELLFVIVVIATLAGLIFAALGSVQEKARGVRETNAARQLVAAYLAAAADRDGELLVAHYEGAASEVDSLKLTTPSGKPLGAAELHRYPYRLAPYLQSQIENTMLVNKNGDQIRKAFSGSMFEYGVSLCPAFGINYYFVGGYKVDNAMTGEADCATRLSQVEKPSSLIVFATAFSEVNGERIAGRFGVEPPNYRTKLWDQNLHVDPRHSGKALCAFLDGSVRTYTVEELRDMRLWSKNAAIADDRDYKVAATGSSGVQGGGRR